MQIDATQRPKYSLIDPIVLSDAIVAQGERYRARARRRTYVKTVVRCASHSGSPEQSEACLLRADGYYRIGKELYTVNEREAAMTACHDEDVERVAARVEERRRKRHHLSQQFVDDDEARMLQRYAKEQCSPLIVDVYDRSLSASASENVECETGRDDDERDCDECFLPICSHSGGLDAGAGRPTVDASPSLHALYCRSSYVCYVLQSHVRPSRTYVGITKDRFKRLRQHNGEIVGGAKATRGARPWRMVAFVDGFGTDKSAALRFEWSMHHPRVRRLVKPWHGTQGRLHCASQLLQGETWCQTPLRLWVVSSCSDVRACAADTSVPLDLTEQTSTMRLACATFAASRIAQTAET